MNVKVHHAFMESVQMTSTIIRVNAFWDTQEEIAKLVCINCLRCIVIKETKLRLICTILKKGITTNSRLHENKK